MNRATFAKVLGVVGALVLTVAGFLFAEGWIVATVVTLGPLGGFLGLFAVSCALSGAIVWVYDAQESRCGPFGIVSRARRWIASHESSASKTAVRFAHTSEWLAFLIMSVTIGPLLTSIAVKLRGTKRPIDYGLAMLGSLVFSVTWALIYTGGFELFKALLHR